MTQYSPMSQQLIGVLSACGTVTGRITPMLAVLTCTMIPIQSTLPSLCQRSVLPTRLSFGWCNRKCQPGKKMLDTNTNLYFIQESTFFQFEIIKKNFEQKDKFKTKIVYVFPLFKGTVSRDFQPLVFSSNNFP
jgi:hypothetical protein